MPGLDQDESESDILSRLGKCESMDAQKCFKNCFCYQLQFIPQMNYKFEAKILVK